MSADLEKLKAFLYMPLYDQPDGRKGLLQPLEDDSDIGYSEMARKKLFTYLKSAFTQHPTRENFGRGYFFVFELICHSVVDPDLKSIPQMGKLALEYLEDQFSRHGYSIKNFRISDPSNFVEKVITDVPLSEHLDVRIGKYESIFKMYPDFVTYDGEIVEYKAKRKHHSSFDLTTTLSTEWARVALKLCAPVIVQGLSAEFHDKVVQKIVVESVFNDDIDDLCRLIDSKYSQFLEHLFKSEISPRVFSDDSDENHAVRVACIRHTLGEDVLSKFVPEFSDVLLGVLARDKDIIAAFNNHQGIHRPNVKSILWAELGLNHEAGPA